MLKNAIVDLLVQDLLGCEPAAMVQRLAGWTQGSRAQDPARPRKIRSEADWIAHDITTLRNVGARLEARLLATPPGTFAEGVEQVIDRGLAGLVPVLDTLAKTARRKLGTSTSEDAA